MIKHYCDICGLEFEKKDLKKVYIVVKYADKSKNVMKYGLCEKCIELTKITNPFQVVRVVKFAGSKGKPAVSFEQNDNLPDNPQDLLDLMKSHKEKEVPVIVKPPVDISSLRPGLTVKLDTKVSGTLFDTAVIVDPNIKGLCMVSGNGNQYLIPPNSIIECY